MPARISPGFARRAPPPAADGAALPSHTTARSVRHSATDMFDLVADLENYPRFVPLCDGMTVRTRRQEGDVEVITATMSVRYRFLSESFTSRVRLDRGGLAIRAENLDGPFRKLENIWSFTPMSEDECTVRFTIDYEFRSRTLAMMMGAVFDRAFRKFAEAFERRADVVYGV